MENLYLIKCNEFYKIGIANDLQSRLASLQTGNPYPLVVEACFEFPNAGVMEKALHQRFSGFRKLGEWFELGNSDIGDLLTLCGMLGGKKVSVRSELIEQDKIEEAEEIQEAALDSAEKWDFQAMFADGWQMQVQDGRGKYWIWRKRKDGQDQSIWGGTIATLPCQSIEEMRRILRDGKLYQPYMKELTR